MRAAADGKRVAAAIAAAARRRADRSRQPRPIRSTFTAWSSGAHGASTGSRSAPPASRHRTGFEETALGYTAEEAIAEASRCLDCHRICSLCVGVCPNMALLTYEIGAGGDRPAGARRARRCGRGDGIRRPFVADQRLQIAVLTDFCNECGNCVTACPTSGSPYRDKPRLYLDRADFMAQESNAFMRLGDGVMEGRFAGRTHRISVDDAIEYRAPTFRAPLARRAWN